MSCRTWPIISAVELTGSDSIFLTVKIAASFLARHEQCSFPLITVIFFFSMFEGILSISRFNTKF